MEYPSDEALKEMYEKWEEMTGGRDDDHRPMQAVMDEIDLKFKEIEDRLFYETLSWRLEENSPEVSANMPTGSVGRTQKPSTRPPSKQKVHPPSKNNSTIKKSFVKPPTGREIHALIIQKTAAKESKKSTRDAQRMRKQGKILTISSYFNSLK